MERANSAIASAKAAMARPLASLSAWFAALRARVAAFEKLMFAPSGDGCLRNTIVGRKVAGAILQRGEA